LISPKNSAFLRVPVASVLQIDSKVVAARKTVRPPPGRARPGRKGV